MSGKSLAIAMLSLAFTASAGAQAPQVEKNVSMKMALMASICRISRPSDGIGASGASADLSRRHGFARCRDTRCTVCATLTPQC